MKSNWRERYGEKIVDMKRAMGLIQRGDHIFVGSGSGTPTALLKGMVEHRERLAGHTVTHILTLGEAPHVNPELKSVFRHNALFIGSNVRHAVQAGHADYTPVFLSEIPGMIRSGRIPVDVALISVSPPDRHGFCSLGTDVAATRAAIRACKVLIAEINEEMPTTAGNTGVHTDRIDAMVPANHPLPELCQGGADETAQRIGRYIAGLVEDGSTLQLGIGKIPDAVLSYLGDRKDLGIHTEMFSDGVIPLIEKGIVNCRRKSLHPGKAITSFIMGSSKLYEFVDNNEFVEFHPCDYTNDPFVIAQNDKMVAINTALEVDLTGQVCSDSIGSRFYSGIGGQVDFIRGAARSRGGKPIIALPSTAMGGAASRIVPHLSEGAGVVTTRGDVHYVVTEYGVATLHGRNVRERALALIEIAHPKFRPWLLAEAKRRSFIYRDQKELPVHITQYPERFERQVRLPEGVEMWLRPIRPTDEPSLQDLFYDLSEETILQRFFTPKRALSPMQLQDLCNIDYDRDMAILACLRSAETESDQIIGVARYYQEPATGMGEVSFVVADAWQGRGVGTCLLDHIVQVARRQGIRGFIADCLPDNDRLIQLFRKSGYPLNITDREGIKHVEMPFGDGREQDTEMPEAEDAVAQQSSRGH